MQALHDTLTIRVNGKPVPQGSMRTVARGVVIHNNAKALNAWRQQIAWACLLSITASERESLPLDEPLSITLTFYLERPKSVRRALPFTKPDLDKLVRAVLDALQLAHVIVEDSRVVTLHASKHYASAAELAGVEIQIHRESKS